MDLSLTKRILLSAGAAFAVATFSFAGTAPMEKNVAPMAPAPECTWTGFYIGGNIGITELQSRFTDVDAWGLDVGEQEGANATTVTLETPGFIGGGQIGYNYQWQDLVFGIEADASGLAGADNRVFGRAAQSEGTTEDFGADNHGKVDFMSTLRVRLGVSVLNNRLLLYATGGGAYAHGYWDSYYHYYSTGYNPVGYYDTEWKGDDWRWGWVGGFGGEYALNCHWSLRAEALYTWLNSNTVAINGPPQGYYHLNGYNARFRFEDDLSSFRVGINYKFTGFGGH